jgi:hypothetical protein
VTYDAVLSLDYYSSMWNEFNTFSVERAALVLSMNEPPWKEDKKEDFLGFYKVWCDRNYSRKACRLILPTPLLSINNHNASYNITIQLDSQTSLLPPALFTHWQFHQQKDLFIYSGPELIIHLSSQFEYGVNEESDEIILGIDLLHYFQKVEYGVELGYYKMWYSHIYDDNSLYGTQKLIVTIFIGTILSTLFYWITSPNYDILYVLMRGEMLFDYAFSQSASEFLSIGIALILWLLTLIFTEPIDTNTFIYTHSDHKKRILLFLLLSVYNVTIMVIYLIKHWRLTRRTGEYYLAYGKSLANGTKNEKTKTTSQVESKTVITRNLSIMAIMSSNLLLILNYLSEEKTIYTFIMIIISLMVLYYYIKFLFLSLLYLSKYNTLSSEISFVFLFIGNLSVFLFFLCVSVPTIYYSFLNEVNSMYSESILYDCILITLSTIGTIAACAVFLPIVNNRLRGDRRKKN